MRPNTFENRAQMGPRGAKMEPTWRQDSKQIDKKTKIRQRTPFPQLIHPYFERKSTQHGSNLAPKIEPKSRKIRCKNRPFFWYLLGSFFNWILVDFWYQNGAKLVSKWEQKSMLTSKGRFYKSTFKTIRKINDFWGFRKLGAKIDQKSIQKWNPRRNASWHRLFTDFRGFGVPCWLQKSTQDRSDWPGVARRGRRLGEAWRGVA